MPDCSQINCKREDEFSILLLQAYDILKTVGGLTNDELVEAFLKWNKASFWIAFDAIWCPADCDSNSSTTLEMIFSHCRARSKLSVLC